MADSPNTANTATASPAHAAHDVEVIHEHDRNSGQPSWLVRMALGVGGIVLLAVAFVLWQMHIDMGGRMSMILPWIIVAAILLGAAAVIESITSTVWVTLIGGIFLLGATFILAGRVVVNFDAPAHAVFVTDRYTGQTELCTRDFCRALPDAEGGQTISLPLPHLSTPQHK